jgi:hypothetical protein
MDSHLGRRLQVAGVVLAGIGLVTALASHPLTGALFAIGVDLAFWPPDGSPDVLTLPTERVLAAVAGGVMAGWGAMLLVLGRGASVARALLTGGLAWFVVDSSGSLVAGVPLNAAGNVAFLGLIAWAVRPARRVGGSRSDVPAERWWRASLGRRR